MNLREYSRSLCQSEFACPLYMCQTKVSYEPPYPRALALFSHSAGRGIRDKKNAFSSRDPPITSVIPRIAFVS